MIYLLNTWGQHEMWFSNSFWNTTLLRLSKWYPSPPKKTKPLAKLLAKSWKLQSLHIWQTNLVCHYSFKPQLKDIFVFWGSSSIIIQLFNDWKQTPSWMIPTRSWSMSVYSLYPHYLWHSISTKYSHVSRKLLNTPHVCWFMSNTDCCFVSHKPRIASHWKHQTAPLHRSRCPFFQLQPLFRTLWPIFVRTFRGFPKMVVPQ